MDEIEHRKSDPGQTDDRNVLTTLHCNLRWNGNCGDVEEIAYRANRVSKDIKSRESAMLFALSTVAIAILIPALALSVIIATIARQPSRNPHEGV